MKKNLPLLWAVLVCLITLPGLVQAQNHFRTTAADLAEVSKAVESTRNHWTYMFPAGELPEYGFMNGKELAGSVAGSPMHVYYMSRNQNTGAVNVEASPEYLVPLMLNGEARALLTVAFFEGRYQVVSVGEMNLAKDVSPYLAQHKSKNSPLVWLKDVNHSADFIAVRGTSLDASSVVFTPLFTAKRASIMEPVTFRNLISRIQNMPVQFD